MPIKTLSRSFAGGEITPELYGRIDLGKYQTGMARSYNVVPLPHGPAVRRRGTTFVREAKFDNPDHIRLIPFAYSADQTMVLEFGNMYIRFHTLGATLLSGGTPYEVTQTSFAGANLYELDYAQSGDIMTLVAQPFPIFELKRLGATNWTLTYLPWPMKVTTSPPSNVTVTPDHSYPTDPDQKQQAVDGEEQQEYVVTALVEDGETAQSAPVSTTNNLATQGANNVITWSAVTGAVAYNVYKRKGGAHSFIGQATGLTFTDDNIMPDTLKSPPTFDHVLNTPGGNRPSAVCYFEQRRWFGGTENSPQTLYATATGSTSNMGYTRPTTADGSITATLAALKMDEIRYMVPLSDMVVLTSSGEWRVFSEGRGAITPMNIAIKTQGYAGCAKVKPAVTPGTILYAQSPSGRVRELAYSRDTESFRSTDLTIMAPHLFVGNQVKDIALQKAPYQILWVLRTDGTLLSLTYLPEQEVYGWAQHKTKGKIKSICTVTEGGEDILYMAVHRVINGADRVFIERMASWEDDTAVTAPAGTTVWDGEAFCDAAFDGKGSPTTSISGLHWLEGEEVVIKTDGGLHPRRTVVNGKIELDYPAERITVGLHYDSEFMSLPVADEASAAGAQGAKKNVNRVHIRVKDTTHIMVGPSFDKMVKYPVRDVATPYGAAPEPITGEIAVNIPPSWNTEGHVCIKQSEPLDMQIVSMVLEIAPGG